MNLLKKYFSYLKVIPERSYKSALNGTLEINWLYGKKVLDTKYTNYSYGNLGKVLHKGLKSVSTDFCSEGTSILILGLGGGDVVKQLRDKFKSSATITAVEIDSVIIEIAIKEFGIIPNSKLDLIHNDASVFMKYCKERYDLVIVDLFTDDYIPGFVFQPHFIQSVHNVLNLKGSVIFNTFILSDVHEVRNKKFVENLKKYFSVWEFKKLYGHNHLIITQKIKMKKYLYIVTAFLGSLAASAQYTKDINTNRPSSSMGAYSVSKGIFQIEGGYMYQNDEFHTEKKNTHNNFQLQLRYGDMLENLEFIADLHFSSYNQTDYNLNVANSGFKHMNFGAKFLIYDHYKYYVEKRNVYSWKANQRFKWGRLIPAVSVYAGGQFNFKHNIYYPELPEIGLKTMLIAQQHLSKRFSITYNFIGENITEEEFRNISYIVTASLGLSDRLSIFGEHHGIIDRKYNNSAVPFMNDALLKGGLTYKINQNLQIDAFGGTSIENTPHKIHAGIGASWRNHKKYEFKDPTEL